MNEGVTQNMDRRQATRFISNIFLDILITILTCGIYNLFIQYRQIQAVNYLLGQSKYSFMKWGVFSLLTCFIYHIYFEYSMAGDINESVKDKSPNLQAIVLGLSLMGLPIIADAIIQDKINRHFGYLDV